MARVVSGLVLLSLLSGVLCSRYDPKPRPGSVVTVGTQARFTVLTERLVRMEWGQSHDKATFAFVNRNLPTPHFTSSTDGEWTVIETSKLKLRYRPDNVTFGAGNLEVSVTLADGSVVKWSPSPGVHQLSGNLLGTIRTLNKVDGAIELNCLSQPRADLHCAMGLVSTSGYVVVDDTNYPQFDDSEWPWVVNKTYPEPEPLVCGGYSKEQRVECGYLNISAFDCTGRGCCFDNSTAEQIPSCYLTSKSNQDLYFFGHGRDYSGALHDFIQVAGKVPIPPRYSLGVYYSRWHAYSDQEELGIVHEYQQRGIPLDVLVMDMDWHITFYKEKGRDQAGQHIGWTGYTWDSYLFPEPKKFLDHVKSNGIKVTLNLHPAAGVQYWEEKYAAMATAMGVDPSTKEVIPFAPANKTYITNWFKIVLAERETEGVDFWWLDYNQGEDWIKIPGANPTFWQNYIFFTNPYHWNTTSPQTRPLILHRWGGLGNHRYQAGFSGDVIPSWPSLVFQVYFTLTASNVAHTYWSHDIGGHTVAVAPELYTRWMQFGVFSPMVRPHSGKAGDSVRRIWAFPNRNYEIMRSALLLRQALLPYIYTAARETFLTGVGVVRPMYYHYAESSEAYNAPEQYMFGPSLLVAPVVTEMDNATQMASKDIWIPNGTFVSWFSGRKVVGPKNLSMLFTLSDIPVFVKAGSIIAMRTGDTAPLGSAEEIPTELNFKIFLDTSTASSGYIEMYEDDGWSDEYLSDGSTCTTRCATTKVAYDFRPNSFSLRAEVLPVNGSFRGQPPNRSYQFTVPNFWPAERVALTLPPATVVIPLPYADPQESFADYEKNCWTYDGSSLSLVVNLVERFHIKQNVVVEVSYASFKEFDPHWFPGFPGRLARLQEAKAILDNLWSVMTVYQEDYRGLLNATEVGAKVTYDPSQISMITQPFEGYVIAAKQEINALKKLHNTDSKKQILALIESDL